MAHSKGLLERFSRVVGSDDHILCLAQLGEEVVGYTAAQGYGRRLRSGEESVRLNDLLVQPTFRRRGVGRALFESVKIWSRERGARYLEWQSSREGIGFYERLGLRGDPCPQPDYPFFEIDFGR